MIPTLTPMTIGPKCWTAGPRPDPVIGHIHKSRIDRYLCSRYLILYLCTTHIPPCVEEIWLDSVSQQSIGTYSAIFGSTNEMTAKI